eukprot:8043171-Pyramimonas_sp.AAC.1
MHWEPLVRWIAKRARRDARALEVPLVFLQAADECQTIKDKETYSKMLIVANIYLYDHPPGDKEVRGGGTNASLDRSDYRSQYPSRSIDLTRPISQSISLDMFHSIDLTIDLTSDLAIDFTIDLTMDLAVALAF